MNRGRRRETDTAAALCARATVFKRGESIGCDPKPGDLYASRVKRVESHVEAR